MNRIKNFVAAGMFLGLLVPAPLLEVRADDLGSAFERIPQWNLGDASADLVYVANEVVQAAKDPSMRRSMEDRLIGILESEATVDAKRFALRQLFVIGTEASVGPLSQLLDDPEMGHLARHVLEVMPGDAADSALRDALERHDGTLIVGVIDSIGKRGDVKAVEALTSLGLGADEKIVSAVFAALGRIPSDEAVRGIANLRTSLFSEACCFHPVESIAEARRAMAPRLKAVAADAYLSAAKRLHQDGRLTEAAEIYEELYRPDEPVMHRIAAIEGLLRVDPGKALPLLVGAIQGEDERFKAAALSFIRETPGEEGTRAIADQLAAAPDDVREQLLFVLGDRGDPAARVAVIEAVGSSSERVRSAAVQTLGRIGEGADVALLIRVARLGEGDERNAARDALGRLRGEEIDNVLIRTLEIAEPPFQVEVIRALGTRQAAQALPALLRAAADNSGAVRVAALQILQELAGDDTVPMLLDILLDSSPGLERLAAENAVVEVSRRSGKSTGAASVHEIYPEVPDPSLNLVLLRILGRIGEDESLNLLYPALENSTAEVRNVVVRALADWPSPAPIKTVEELAAEAASPIHRVLALRGYIRMVGLWHEAGATDPVSLYRRAMDLAERPEERLLVISRLAELRSKEALALVQTQVDDEALREAAELAAQRIGEYLSRPAQVSASHNSGGALNAVDGNLETRWASGQQQTGGEWFLLDFGVPTEVHRITLNAAGSTSDYPRGYEVYISNTLESDGEPVAAGEGSGPITEISLPATPGRYIRIVQTGQVSGLFWSIHDIVVDTKGED